MEYKELDDPIEEVYRIRCELLEEYGGIKGYLKHIDDNHSKLVEMGFSFVNP